MVDARKSAVLFRCERFSQAGEWSERTGSPRSARRRGERGDTLGLLVLWPGLIVAILLLMVQAFIMTNAQSGAQIAASEGLRAAWRFAAEVNFNFDDARLPYEEDAPHPDAHQMAEAARDAVARAAGAGDGWRWWSPGATRVDSNWCSHGYPGDPENLADRPDRTETGWVRVTVTGEVWGPLAALWPNRLDRVYAVAEGPALLDSGLDAAAPRPGALPPC